MDGHAWVLTDVGWGHITGKLTSDTSETSTYRRLIIQLLDGFATGTFRRVPLHQSRHLSTNHQTADKVSWSYRPAGRLGPPHQTHRSWRPRVKGTGWGSVAGVGEEREPTYLIDFK